MPTVAELRLEPRQMLDASVPKLLISEFLAANADGLLDQDGDTSDWLELFNPTSEAVDLAGWALTDDAEVLDKWVFPEVNLAPSGFLVVFASGKNRATAGSELHTNFRISASGGYLGLTRPDGTVSDAFTAYAGQRGDISYGHPFSTSVLVGPGSLVSYRVPTDGLLGTSWKEPGFAPGAGWSSGPAPLGYGVVQPGFRTRYVKGVGEINDLNAAKQVLDTPALQEYSTVVRSDQINFLDNGPAGNFGNDAPFPTQDLGLDYEWYVIDARGMVTIPSAGAWTFGVNSDDGFELVLKRDGEIYRSSFEGLRPPEDTLATFELPAAGEYEIQLIAFENYGWASVELFAAPGARGGFDPAFRLVGDTASGGLAVTSAPDGAGNVGTDLQPLMQGVNSSLYVHMKFIVTDPSAYDTFTLRLRYDDGFVAYLNGVEIARRGAPATPVWNSTATASRGSEAWQPETISLTDRLNLLVAGANVLAIQALNVTAGDGDFLIAPELIGTSLGVADSRFFREPTPGDFNGTAYAGLVEDVSFSAGRGFYSAPVQVQLATPTAGAEIRYTLNGSEPDATSPLYTAPLTVSETTVLRAAAFIPDFVPSKVRSNTYLFLNDVIQQSSDGSAPAGWPTSWGWNTVDYGMDPEIVNDARFGGDNLKNALRAIPTISITTDLDNLFGPTEGIYANPYGKGRAWERPASVELINPDGSPGFQINAGLRIRGGYSRSYDNPKHAFRLFFRGEYDGDLSFPLFGTEGARTFAKVDLRTDQNYSWSFGGDSRHTAVRDVFSRDTQRDMGQAYTRSRYYHLYLDGQYWGMFQSQERAEANFAATYFGGDPDNYDVVKVENYSYQVYATDGNMDAWRRLYDAALAGFTSNADYYEVQGRNPDGTRNLGYENLVEIDNLIDYMQVMLFTGNFDAPISAFLGNERPNNFYAIRDRTGTAGFRFFAHDSEHTLFHPEEDRNLTLDYPNVAGSAFPYFNPQYLHMKLMENAEYRMRFADRVQTHFFHGGALTPEKTIARFASRAGEIQQAILGESARWGDSKTDPPLNPDHWQNEIDYVLNSYLPVRSGIVLDQFRSNGLFPMLSAPRFLVGGLEQYGGRISAGTGLRLDAMSGTVYYTLDGSDPRLPGGGLNPNALAFLPGISPDLVLQSTTTLSARAFNGNWSAISQADFLINDPANASNLIITELQYNPHAPDVANGELPVDDQEYEFVELRNIGPREIDLSNVRFTVGITYNFSTGTVRYLAPGAYAILAKNPNAFRSRYGERPHLAGPYGGNLSNGGEAIRLVDAAGGTIADFAYDDEGAWPKEPDGGGKSLVVTALGGNLSLPASWRASVERGGSPGARGNTAPDLIVPVTAETDEDNSISSLPFQVGDAETDAAALVVEVASDNPELFPAWLLFIGGTGNIRTLTATPTPNRFGTANLAITVRDGAGIATVRTIAATVRAVNDPPYGLGDSYTTTEDTSLTILVDEGVLANDHDIESDPLTASLIAGPSYGELLLNPDGSFTYQPLANHAGSDAFTYMVSDVSSNSAPVTVSIWVAPVNDPPVLAAIPAQVVDEGLLLLVTAVATDPDALPGTLRYELAPDRPAGMTINALTGEIRWVPPIGPRTATVRVLVKDGASPPASDERTLTIDVRNVTPTLSIGGDGTAYTGQIFSRAGSFNDPGAGPWTATVQYGSAPAQALTLNADKSFVLQHTFDTVGSYPVVVRLRDSAGAEAVASFQVNATLPPDVTPPLLSGIGSVAVKRRLTGLQLTFSEALQPGTATVLSTYQLVRAGRDRKFNTPDDQIVALRAAALDATGKVVTLTSTRTLRTRTPYQLTVGDTLKDQAGNILDGDHNNAAGGPAVRKFTIPRALSAPVTPVATVSSLIVTTSGDEIAPWPRLARTRWAFRSPAH